MKRFSWLLLAICVLGSSTAAVAQSVTVIVNGQTMSFSQPPIERAGRVFVPLRGIFEQLGASVVYSNGQINATAHGRTVSLTIGSTQATVAGEPAMLDVAPFIVGATTFVPLRFISQALGAAVNWDDSTSTVTIAGRGGGGGYAPQPPPPPPGPRPPRPPALVTTSPTGTIYNANPTFRFGFDRPVTMERLRVWIDGTRIGVPLRQSDPASFAFDSPWRLSRGPHRVRVTGVTASGANFDLSWSFVRG
ncbi:MAG TPA: copper amine oxidase N-terminal domain-containing protein [Candidatus Cybelea sp.]|jgi:hypothetical protein|nr:copper amine oxidase N-terminal domain-containing protein [Candidatus Cybelea sp.]